MSEETKGTKDKVTKDFEFLLAMVKTGTLTVNYDAASTMLGWNKKKTMNKMSDFRKAHDWPINKGGPPTTSKGSKPAKRVAKEEGEDGGEAVVKKPAAKRAKGKKDVKEEEPEDEDAAADDEGGEEE